MNYFFDQIPFFAISKMAKNQFLTLEKVYNCQKCNFTKKNSWFIWFHEFFCLNFLKFFGPLCARNNFGNNLRAWLDLVFVQGLSVNVNGPDMALKFLRSIFISYAPFSLSKVCQARQSCKYLWGFQIRHFIFLLNQTSINLLPI